MNEKAEYSFEIDAFTPETLPMARLAEYLVDLSNLLGEAQSVHFLRIDGGSAKLVHIVDTPAALKVRERVSAVRRGEGTQRARAAFRSIDDRLASDNATALLSEQGAEVLKFPGRTRAEPLVYGPFNQVGTLRGVPIAVGGKSDPCPVHLQDGDRTHNCVASRSVVRRLSKHLFEDALVVTGTGRWFRNADGIWELRRFRISDFEVLDSEPLTTALEGLRAIHSRSDWSEFDDQLAAMRDIHASESS